MSEYKHNYRAFDRLVLAAPFMVDEMRKRAEKVRDRAEVIAPDATPFGVGYKYAFEVSSGVRTKKTTRAFGMVTNTDPAARFIEFGTKEGVIQYGKNKGRKHGATPEHRTLGKALGAAGE